MNPPPESIRRFMESPCLFDHRLFVPGFHDCQNCSIVALPCGSLMESMRSTLHLERTTAKNDPHRLCRYLFWYDLDTLVCPNIPRNGRSITPLVLKDLDTFIGHTVRQEGRFAAGVVEKTEQLINMWIGFGRILNTLATQLDISILLKLPVRAAEHLFLGDFLRNDRTEKEKENFLRINSPFPFDKEAHEKATSAREGRIRIFRQRAEFLRAMTKSAESMRAEDLMAAQYDRRAT